MAHGDAKKTIRQLRQERGWSQIALAVHLGVNPTMVYRWERGATRPSPYNALRLARLFGVSVAAIAVGPAEPASRSEE